MEEIAGTQKLDGAGAAVCGVETGGSIANKPLPDKSCCELDSSIAQARSGFVQTDSIPHSTNPNWLNPSIFPMNYRPVNNCHGYGATRIAPPCTFQGDFPRVVLYYAEQSTLSQMSIQSSRVKPPACCERVDFEGTASQAIYAPTMEQDAGHVCGARYINRDNVLICPAPWVYEGRIFPGTSAMGVNWVPDYANWGQQSQSSNTNLEESFSHEMPDPVYPSAHCNTCTTNYSRDLDVDTQRHLEEEIAQEILILSQKLAILKAQRGARRPVYNTKSVVLDPQASPLDVKVRRTQRDPKSAISGTSSSSISIRCQGTTHPRSRASSSSRNTSRQAAESRFKPEDRKLEEGGIKGANSSTPAQSSSRESDCRASSSTTTLSFDKIHPNSRGGNGDHSSENSITGSRAITMHNRVLQDGENKAVNSVQGCEHNFREDSEDGKASNKVRSFSKPSKRFVRVKGAAGLHLQECSHSNDTKENLWTGETYVQGHSYRSNQLDWEEFRFEADAGLRGNQRCMKAINSRVPSGSNSQKELADVQAETWQPNAGTKASVSKSAQPGKGDSSAERAWTSTDGNDKQEGENSGKRHADSSIENSHVKSTKRDADSPKAIFSLDFRIAHHLHKAGLRRKPYFRKTPGLGLVPCKLRLKKTFGARSPPKDCGKRLRRRMLFDLNVNLKTNPLDGGAALEDVDDKNSDSGSQPRQLLGEETGGSEETVDAQCQRKDADYKAEYETFVENTAVRLHVNLNNEDHTSTVNSKVLTCGVCLEEDRLKLSEAPILCLSKPSQPTRKTFIRCIELVMAMKKKNQLTKLNGRQAFGNRYSYRRMDCLVESKNDFRMESDLHNKADANRGGSSHNTEDADGEQVIREPVEPPDVCCWDEVNRGGVESSAFENLPSAAMLAHGREMKLFEDSLFKSVAQEEAPTLVFKEHSENTYDLGFGTNLDCDEGIPPLNPEPSIVDQVSSLASVLSRVMPKQMHCMNAEQLRARWEELIDALEKERLGLPKIKTGGRKMGVTARTNSPRDSGCVKRIAEQMKNLGATTLNLEKEGLSTTQKEKGLEDVGITRERAHWNKVEQKQAVVF